MHINHIVKAVNLGYNHSEGYRGLRAINKREAASITVCEAVYQRARKAV